MNEIKERMMRRGDEDKAKKIFYLTVGARWTWFSK